MDIYEKFESNVRGYCRSFPVTFTKAQNATLTDSEGNQYIDFLGGAGTLNYGHNNPNFKDALIDYIQGDNITHGLDMHTEAKTAFLETYERLILKPRGMKNYKMQFTGPTGTNAVEAALKIARKNTGRTDIVSFTNGFHGVTQGAAAVTANGKYKKAIGMPLPGVHFMPFDGYLGDYNTLHYFEKALQDKSSGLGHPAAVIVECIQGEGGLNAASGAWLLGLQALCKRYDMLLIVDDIQAGCGRSGTYFSFEEFGIEPDIITQSKSLSGYGLPMAIVLLKAELDTWEPGEHNGTFRGNNHAFVTATKALETYWADDTFAKQVQGKAKLLRTRLKEIQAEHGGQLKHKGRGIMQGLECANGDIADKITELAFERGLVIETSGSDGQVVKVLAPLTIEEEKLKKGLEILDTCIGDVMAEQISKAS
ncbi:MAG: diaminobutyrate--2-oxoglutarate transaminase [Oceanospirillaceae bacterium]|uniref:diaminobutyrate--2-oxoglutarate transaminase n=1 Tax=unclassified Thalassolituus TaxID=2624967 RepID=UPI000C0AA537|nr:MULTISPECIES: diaminobutyrate--2-oxoglutarate transaminase [unclassified Thalassolituus]MAK89749.1 diaminobutyrate--2-oxoglutarate transaminase [Thalassolituus sp.]MAS24641.1 diaminobutyrate--2-oxoglutarate transaminase [Oceanospirillaceae bacterium]MAX98402.1 diaminobutyrate--2-oxoglutarate transaminase [Oceanospirillaceae bacterium]MBL35613.1 diaminobutyrate--2-oxoglutarate transaminase [Oceanospirillaceae bacterium]MBS51210.1 diaminobutyrate--2-oxoglutarate transaminase [Oceanospirillace|tara:strand:+ start:314 stop:1582 length:1269 start_codon:yes stop_codon:yes gene_type:complete